MEAFLVSAEPQRPKLTTATTVELRNVGREGIGIFLIVSKYSLAARAKL